MYCARARADYTGVNFDHAALQTGKRAAIMKEALNMQLCSNKGEFCLWNIRRWAKLA
jgi:hypothetical protein